jgi:hypothetical protein
VIQAKVNKTDNAPLRPSGSQEYKP